MELSFTEQPGCRNSTHLKPSPPSSSFPAGVEPPGAREEPKPELRVNFASPSLGRVRQPWDAEVLALITSMSFNFSTAGGLGSDPQLEFQLGNVRVFEL